MARARFRNMDENGFIILKNFFYFWGPGKAIFCVSCYLRDPVFDVIKWQQRYLS